MRRPVAISLIAVALIGFAATPAQAAGTGTVSVVQSTKVRYWAAAGQRNRVVITRSGTTVTIDDVYAIKAGTGCKRVRGDRTRVRCTLATAPTQVIVWAGDRNDRITNDSDLRLDANGERGSDVIVGGPRRDRIEGDTGNDRIYGRGGRDSLNGFEGDDYIDAGAGYDFISAGPGDDVLHGGSEDDFIYGEAGDDTLYGDAGGDYLNGDDGSADARDKRGRDVLYGGAGDDQCEVARGDARHDCER
ncbi:calcium-binding protein [Actinoplanes oblitus]|uniref:Calcium-binding protein n=1 Tax=Actinoplanes oblitus TaxID=3040509 RepID=A0ABY8WET5_9ACTN|nr:calcium-binding protein [Actinoplanes oblitus]WIM96369.1 calcium-binding protein [Actinoplanes oblitus]